MENERVAKIDPEHARNLALAQAYRPPERKRFRTDDVNYWYTQLTRDDFPQIPETCFSCEDFLPHYVRIDADDKTGYAQYLCRINCVARNDRDMRICRWRPWEEPFPYKDKDEDEDEEFKPRPHREKNGQWTLF